ncbi:MAG: hypothetical protein GY804_09790 [Alphaproteobacteria bacterium]|nr:hypothetical protein [Alphaproteobacteria bacterium]
MISKVILEKNRHATEVNPKYDMFLDSFDITHLLVDDIYILNKRLEGGGKFDFMGSDIVLKFDNREIKDGLYFENLFTDAAISVNNFHTIEIYRDGLTTPEFWGFVGWDNISYDRDKDEWELNATDVIERYWDKWEDDLLPAQSAVGSLFSLDNWLRYIMDFTLLEGVDISTGDLFQILFGTAYSNSMVGNANYNVATYFKELLKWYGAYAYVGGDKRLKFTNRMQNTGVIHNLTETDLLNANDYLWEEALEYDAIAISYRDDPGDPDLLNPPAAGGSGKVAGDVLLRRDSKGYFIPMIVRDGTPLDNFPEAVQLAAPQYINRYLDLRNRPPAITIGTWTYNPWEMLGFNVIASDDEVAKRYNAYKDILFRTKLKRLDVNDVSFELLDRVNFEGGEFTIIEATKNLYNETSRLLLREAV